MFSTSDGEKTNTPDPGRRRARGCAGQAEASPIGCHTVWLSGPGWVLHLGEHVCPFLQHLGFPVGDADGEMVVAGITEFADTVTELGLCSRERERADQIGGTHLLLLGTEEHEMPAVVLQIAGICRLVLLV